LFLSANLLARIAAFQTLQLVAGSTTLKESRKVREFQIVKASAVSVQLSVHRKTKSVERLAHPLAGRWALNRHIASGSAIKKKDINHTL
jgi:hypothetical protein